MKKCALLVVKFEYGFLYIVIAQRPNLYFLCFHRRLEFIQLDQISCAITCFCGIPNIDGTEMKTDSGRSLITSDEVVVRCLRGVSNYDTVHPLRLLFYIIIT